MISLREFTCTSGSVALLCTASQACAAQAEPGAGAAIEALQPGWTVVHCGVSRGVLYVTYIEHGKAGIAHAFATIAIRKACTEAGYPIGASAPARGSPAPIYPRPDGTAAAPRSPRPPRPPAKTRVEPSFVAQATGSVVEISGRNDGDTAYHCVVNFSWTFDDDPGGPHSVTAQATLPGHQVNRVVFISGPYRNARFVSLPTWHCNAAE
jgi:hypothetical protein